MKKSLQKGNIKISVPDLKKTTKKKNKQEAKKCKIGHYDPSQTIPAGSNVPAGQDRAEKPPWCAWRQPG